MRQQYPDLVIGAISLSGDMDPVLDFPKYIQDICEDLRVSISFWDMYKAIF